MSKFNQLLILVSVFISGAFALASEPLIRDIRTQYSTATSVVWCSCAVDAKNTYGNGVEVPWVLTRYEWNRQSKVDQNVLSSHISQYSCDYTRVAQCQGNF